jgi:hypothetical protein
MQLVPSPLVPVLHMMTCVLSHERAQAMSASNTWLMHVQRGVQNYLGGGPKLLGRTPNYSEVTWLASMWGYGNDLWSFSLTKIIPGIPLDFGADFLHENKSRKAPKNMSGVVVDVIGARNCCLWLPIILRPVTYYPHTIVANVMNQMLINISFWMELIGDKLVAWNITLWLK